jgi:hypothetical protein
MPNASRQARQIGLAPLDRVAAQIVAVQFDQIEGIEEDAIVLPAVP